MIAVFSKLRGPMVPVIMLLAGCVLPGTVRGGTILWDVEDWPDPNSGPVLQDTLTVDGDAVHWEFSGDTGNLHNSSPNDTNRLRGGTGEDSLLIRWRPDAIGDQISLEISFDHPNGVEAVQMQLFDIDRERTALGNSRWGDRVTVVAVTTSGSVITPTFSGLGSTVGVDGANSLIGLGRSNNNQGNGNALITFIEPIVSVTIEFEDMGVGNFQGNRDHEIGVSSMSFSVASPIPEPSAALMMLCAGFGPVLVRKRRVQSGS
jgi:hypothetical protein